VTHPEIRACLVAIALGLFGVVSEAFAQETAEGPSAPKSGFSLVPIAIELKPLPPEPRPGLCEDKPGGLAWLDRMQADLYRMTCLSAARFDSFFGSAHFDEAYQATHGTVMAGSLWDQRNGLDPTVRFRARLYLPQLSERFNAFIGKVDRDEQITELRDDFDTLPREFGHREDDAVLIGLGYSQPERGAGHFDADAGAELGLPMDPFVKGRYRVTLPFLEHNVLRLRETVFWQHSEGAGATTAFDLERLLAERFLLRLTGSATLTQNTQGVRWFSSVTLYQNLGARRALAYQVGSSGESNLEVPLSDYGFRLIYRRSVLREWLFLELRSSITWPRDTLFERRERNLGVGAGLELQFGERTRR
jgi:hypothetical protein